MCGIVGSVKSAYQSNDWVVNAVSTLKHRGPDDSSYYSNSDICFGMCRLSILDIKGGKQPFVSIDGRYTLVFNGQIYNFKTLRSTLENLGYRFLSASDTEVVLYGYIHFQEKIVEHLEGMFAFAVWDAFDKQLFLARDRFGEKPLSYSLLKNGGIVFSSEIKAILSHPEISREPDLNSIQLMMNFGYVPPTLSAYKSVEKLPPGHYLVWINNEVKVIKYWAPPTQIVNNLSERELIQKLDTLLYKSVELRMISDRGVGSWLSGGVDSSLIAYYMSQIQRNPVETFSATFENESFDESEHSSTIARYLNTNHNVIKIDLKIDRDMPGIIDQLDEPFADSSFIATYLLSKYTSKHRVVVLGGDGGDEAFGGYDRYRIIRLMQGDKFWKSHKRNLIKLMSSGLFRPFYPKKIAKFFEASTKSVDSIDFYKSMMTWIPASHLTSLLASNFNSSLDSWFHTNMLKLVETKRSFEFSTNLWDVMYYLPGDLLPKIDMAAMSFGLEVRSPFLDSSVFSFGLSLPDQLRAKSYTGKYILKQLAKEKLPNQIVNRPKQGFAIPRDEWLRGTLNSHMIDVLSESNSNLCEILDIKVVKDRVKSFNNGEKIDAEIWCLYMLGNWAKRWL